ncbi:MAG: hypothetical protein Q9P01_12835 [Anaerolineae bacterium]|nr:hypothetical protein [Anaerolineae bacterium]
MDKIVVVGSNARVGSISSVGDFNIASIGKNSHIPAGFTVGAGSMLGTDLTVDDFAAFARRQKSSLMALISALQCGSKTR